MRCGHLGMKPRILVSDSRHSFWSVKSCVSHTRTPTQLPRSQRNIPVCREWSCTVCEMAFVFPVGAPPDGRGRGINAQAVAKNITGYAENMTTYA